MKRFNYLWYAKLTFNEKSESPTIAPQITAPGTIASLGLFPPE